MIMAYLTEYLCWRTPRLWKGKKLQINFGAGKILSKPFWFEGIPWKYIFFYWKDYKEVQFRPELLITATWIYISYISVTDKQIDSCEVTFKDELNCMNRIWFILHHHAAILIRLAWVVSVVSALHGLNNPFLMWFRYTSISHCVLYSSCCFLFYFTFHFLDTRIL